MSERGLLLALQRYHDDPGFCDRVAQDPQIALGPYDLDDTERQALIQAFAKEDDTAVRQMAASAGLDWTADHIQGVGALDESQTSTEGPSATGVNKPNAMTGDGYEGVMPTRTAGS